MKPSLSLLLVACAGSLMAQPPKSPLPAAWAGAAFTVFDAAARRTVPWANAHWQPESAGFEFTAVAPGDLRLRARFVPDGDVFLVNGEVENLAGGDRGIALDYRVPFAVAGARFDADPGGSVAAADGDTEENVYPIAAMTAPGSGVGLAIPPTSPCEFGMIGGPAGLGVRFYLGLVPETRRFPNRAPFAFILSPATPGWGFRSLLERYYARYPEFYRNRSGRDGQFLFVAEDGTEPEPPDLSRYFYSCVETQAPWVKRQFALNRAHGIFSLPYSIVGMREVKFLPQLPANYDAAMAAYAGWKLSDNDGHPITKENEAGGRDVHLREQVESSACQTADGRRKLAIRHTPWGGNSVSFFTNPNPDLFADAGRHNVGRDAIELIKQWLDTYPEDDGATVDSLGGNWPALLNYRRDQFPYARYPLTCDARGRPALHNEISHYEYLETLRRELRQRDPRRSYVMANGIYSYAVRPDMPQHYRQSDKRKRFWLGRFFLASQLDFAVSEPGVISSDESLAFMRIAMGRKIYSPTNARFEDPERTRRWVNRCLCYDLFAVNTRRYGDPIRHYVPEGYARDRALFDWFVPKARLLARAGWQPVTAARADAPRIRIERYGAGDRLYFAVLSEADAPQDCTVSLDLSALGLSAAAYPQGWTADEIAYGQPIRAAGPGRFSLRLEPYRTCVLAVRARSPNFP